jgi:hypothetical protein
MSFSHRITRDLLSICLIENKILDESDDYVLIEAGAGEFWDVFVRMT